MYTLKKLQEMVQFLVHMYQQFPNLIWQMGDVERETLDVQVMTRPSPRVVFHLYVCLW